MAHIHYGAAGQANGKAVVVLLPVGGVDAVRCPPCPSSPALPCARLCSAMLCSVGCNGALSATFAPCPAATLWSAAP